MPFALLIGDDAGANELERWTALRGRHIDDDAEAHDHLDGTLGRGQFYRHLRYRKKIALALVEHGLTRPLHPKNLGSPGRDNRLRREHEQIFAAVGKFTL